MDSYTIDFNIKIKRCDMIDNETTLHKRLNDTEFNSYRSPHDLQQSAKSLPRSQLLKAPKWQM